MLEEKLQDIISNRQFEIDNIHQRQSSEVVAPSAEPKKPEDDDAYTHTKVKDTHTQRNLNAIKAIRTDCKATTLDKFFV